MVDLAQEITDITGSPVSDEDVKTIQSAIDSIPKVEFTEYLKIGDEPFFTIMTVDLKQYLDPLTYETIRESLKLMPRSRLRPFFEEKILPVIENFYKHVVWKSLLNLFNEANIEVINRLGLTPWAWEEIKTEAVYMKEATSGLDMFTQEIGLQQLGFNQALEARQRSILEEEYTKLPKLADEGLEIARQAAIKRLLDLKEFNEVSKIIQAYKQATDDEKAVMETGVGLELSPNEDAAHINMTQEIINPELNNALQQTDSIPYYEQVQEYIEKPVVHPMQIFFKNY